MPRTPVGQIVYGNAASLVRASSQYFSRSIIGAASGVTNNFTISGWMKSTDVTLTQHMFQNGNNDGDGYVLMIASSKLRIDLSFVANLNSSTTFVNNTWYHVACVRNAGVWQLYINGLADGGTISNNPNSPGGNTCLGTSKNSGGTPSSSYFGGLLDDWRWYARPLSAAEILDIYNQGSNPSIIVSAASLGGHWKCDESSGNLADSSGNGYTMTGTNTPTFTTGIVQISNTPSRTPCWPNRSVAWPNRTSGSI